MRKIPARFSLLGHEISVVFREDLYHECDCYGRYWHSRNLIELQEPSEEVSHSMVMHTFWHEATHAMLSMLGYDALSADEELVDRLGAAIHQILKTKRGS